MLYILNGYDCFLGRRKNLLARNRSSAGDGLGGQLHDQGDSMKRLVWSGSLAAGLLLAASAAMAEGPEATRAAAQLAPYRQLPKFEAPGEAFDARACMKDKPILSIPASSAVPFLKIIETSMAKSQGHRLQFEGMGEPGPADAVGARHRLRDQQQIQSHRPAGRRRPALPRAASEGREGCRPQGHCRPSYRLRAADPRRRDGVVPIDYKRAGALLADWAIWKTDGNVNAIVIAVNDVFRPTRWSAVSRKSSRSVHAARSTTSTSRFLISRRRRKPSCSRR